MIKGITGESFYEIKGVNEEEVKEDLRRLKEADINSIAVVLAHSYAVTEHENAIGKIAAELGDVHVKAECHELEFEKSCKPFRYIHVSNFIDTTVSIG